MYVGKKIKYLRQRLELTQEDFAMALEISRQHYISIETGKKPISKRLDDKIKNKWGVNISNEEIDTEVFRYNNKGGKKGGSEGGLKGGIFLRGNLGEGPYYNESVQKLGMDLFDEVWKKSKQSIEDEFPNELKRNKNLMLIKLFSMALHEISDEIENKSTFPILTGKLGVDIENYKAVLRKDLEDLEPYEHALNKFAESIKVFYNDLKKAGLSTDLTPYLSVT